MRILGNGCLVVLLVSWLVGFGCSDTAEDTEPEFDGTILDFGGEVDMSPDMPADTEDDLTDAVADLVEEAADEEVIEPPPLCPPDESLELEMPAAGECLTLGETYAIETINANIRLLLVELGASFEFLDNSTLVTRLEEVFDINQECPEDEPDCVLGIDFSSIEDNAGELADDIASDIFNAEQVEESDDCSVTFLMSPDLLCDRDPEFPDEFCVWDHVPVRLMAWAPDEGDIYLELLIGDDRVNIADFRVFASEAGAIIPLPALREGMSVISEAEEEPWDVPSLMEGLIEIGLYREGPEHYYADVSVRQDITVHLAIEQEDPDPTLEYHLHMNKNCPLAEFEVDNSGGNIWARMDVRRSTFDCPLEMFYDCDPETETCDDPQGNVTMRVDNGTGMEIYLDTNSESLDIEQIGLGEMPAMASYNDETIVSLEFNAAYDHRADVYIWMEENDWAIEVSPLVIMNLGLHFQFLTDQFSDLNEWTLAENLGVVLDGAEPPSLLVLDTANFDVEWALKVTDGHLSFPSNYMDVLERAIEVFTGECLVPVPEPTEGWENEHPYEHIQAGTCPG